MDGFSNIIMIDWMWFYDQCTLKKITFKASPGITLKIWDSASQPVVLEKNIRYDWRPLYAASVVSISAWYKLVYRISYNQSILMWMHGYYL